MATADTMTDEQFGSYALDILRRELGLSGFARFLRVYRAGSGDYTRDRDKWLADEQFDDIARQLGLERRP